MKLSSDDMKCRLTYLSFFLGLGKLDADYCLNEVDGNVRFDCRLGCSSSDIDRQRMQ